MKLFMKLFVGVALSLCVYSASAQDTTHNVTRTIKRDAKKVGNKSAEIASKGKASVTDQVYKDKVGPNGQKIYMDDHSRYYWVDKKGHRHYATEAELKDRQ
jgi:hypothetical protein